MKKLIEFSIYNCEYKPESHRLKPTTVSDVLFKEMRRRWPGMDGRENHIKFILEMGSETMSEVLAYLWEQRGIRPCLDVPIARKLEPFEFGVFGKVEFSEDEIANARFLRVFAFGTPMQQINFQIPSLSEQGHLIVTPPKVHKSKLIGHDNIKQVLYCKTVMKESMIKEGFGGLVFEGVEYSPSSRPPKPEEMLWELSSSVIMPSVLNPLMEGSKAPFTPQSRDCYPADLFVPFVLRYEAGAVKKLGDFDIAVTREEFGVRPRIWGSAPWLIVSQRFRRWLLERKLKELSFTPVILEH